MPSGLSRVLTDAVLYAVLRLELYFPSRVIVPADRSGGHRITGMVATRPRPVTPKSVSMGIAIVHYEASSPTSDFQIRLV